MTAHKAIEGSRERTRLGSVIIISSDIKLREASYYLSLFIKLGCLYTILLLWNITKYMSIISRGYSMIDLISSVLIMANDGSKWMGSQANCASGEEMFKMCK